MATNLCNHTCKRDVHRGIGQAHFISQCVYTVSRLGVADVIGNETLTAAEIAGRIDAPVNVEYLERVLRLCAQYGVLHESASNDGSCAFSLTTAGALLQTGAPQPSMACGMLHWNEAPTWLAWTKVYDAVVSAERKVPYKEAMGMGVFDYYAKHPESAQPFNEFMTFFSQGELQVIKAAVDWSQYNDKVVTDVGGSLGTVAATIREAAPGVSRVISFDLPEVVGTAKELPGVEFVGGSFFNEGDIPVSDAIFMKHILHDWSDEDSKKILTNCVKSLKDGGKIILAEAVLPDAGGDMGPIAQTQKNLDLMMLLIGGKERTSKQWQAVAESAGLTVDGITSTQSPMCQIITLSKK